MNIRRRFGAAAVFLTVVLMVSSAATSSLAISSLETFSLATSSFMTLPFVTVALAAERTELPRRYDGRGAGRTASVRDQGDLGTCWAFASLLALENHLLPAENWSFSTDHMSNNPDFAIGQEGGGEYTMALAYLLSWQGPVREEDDPYGDGVSPEGLTAVKHVQEVRILPEYDRDAIKRAVLDYGGVQGSLYVTLRVSLGTSDDGGTETILKVGSGDTGYYRADTTAYYYPQESVPNHDVVIVGWDDDFPKENFAVQPETDGAFLCENSWGSQFGENGFFYVSYCDANLGQTAIAYTGVEDADNYDCIYQSDRCGWIGQLGYGTETAWAANAYTASSAQILEAAGFYATGTNTAYQIYVSASLPGMDETKTAKLRLAAEGQLEDAGYYTIPFQTKFRLNEKERFFVIIRLTTPDAVHPIAVEYDAGDGKCRVDLDDGEGYISPDGETWTRAETEQGCNVCLKAYSRGR